MVCVQIRCLEDAPDHADHRLSNQPTGSTVS
jgi:hypothetical protein